MRNFNFLILLFASNLFSDSFEHNCRNCHFQESQLQMFMSRYTLLYSSEKRIKKALYEYLQNPIEKNSVMPKGFLNRWGVKEKSLLEEKELMKSIDEYYEKYNLKQLLH